MKYKLTAIKTATGMAGIYRYDVKEGEQTEPLTAREAQALMGTGNFHPKAVEKIPETKPEEVQVERDENVEKLSKLKPAQLVARGEKAGIPDAANLKKDDLIAALVAKSTEGDK